MQYLELTKPRLNLLAVLTTWAGFYMGADRGTSIWSLINTLVGSASIAAGCGTLNQWMEVEKDAQMHRTMHRPLPSKKITETSALFFGGILAVGGIILLFKMINPLTAFLGVLAIVSYIFFYTPLKKITSLCILVGAIPGALPPVMGWAAARDVVGIQGVVLFLILFFWQMPHFLAIGWLYRDDYTRAGFPMLSVLDPEGKAVGWISVIYALVLIPISLLPSILKMTTPIYLGVASILGFIFLIFSINLAVHKSRINARKLFLASIIYLPILFGVMVACKKISLG